mmetsp:Transcript_52289/g.158856  ORF Transcript_52289/g.158856 Transcript_52289/m.158856 type:complete len:264 (+) Transcript_52289:409-1200(+)
MWPAAMCCTQPACRRATGARDPWPAPWAHTWRAHNGACWLSLAMLESGARRAGGKASAGFPQAGWAWLRAARVQRKPPATTTRARWKGLKLSCRARPQPWCSTPRPRRPAATTSAQTRAVVMAFAREALCSTRLAPIQPSRRSPRRGRASNPRLRKWWAKWCRCRWHNWCSPGTPRGSGSQSPAAAAALQTTRPCTPPARATRMSGKVSSMGWASGKPGARPCLLRPRPRRRRGRARHARTKSPRGQPQPAPPQWPGKRKSRG